jgi:hypothetical protein
MTSSLQNMSFRCKKIRKKNNNLIIMLELQMKIPLVVLR